jgi:hypothetical protein
MALLESIESKLHRNCIEILRLRLAVPARVRALQLKHEGQGGFISLTRSISAFSGNRCIRNLGTCSRFLKVFYSLWLIAVGATIYLPKPVAHAQSPTDFSISSRKIEDGWWCPESRRTIPHLQIGTADQIELSNSELISATLERANYRSLPPVENAIGYPPAWRSGLETRSVNPASLIQTELLPETFL